MIAWIAEKKTENPRDRAFCFDNNFPTNPKLHRKERSVEWLKVKGALVMETCEEGPCLNFISTSAWLSYFGNEREAIVLQYPILCQVF